MNRTSSSLIVSSGKKESISTVRTVLSKIPAMKVSILYQGTCPKLTIRGRGDLSYELGIDEAGETYVRISGNASSGGFSNEWLALGQIRTLLNLKMEQQKTFSAVTMESLFARRSANNYGYLAAILKTEGVLVVLPGKPVMLGLGNWKPILSKIDSLKEKGVTLKDHIAIAAKEKAEKRALLMSNLRSTKSTKSTDKPNDTSLQDEPSEGVQESRK